MESTKKFKIRKTLKNKTTFDNVEQDEVANLDDLRLNENFNANQINQEGKLWLRLRKLIEKINYWLV